MVRPQEIVWPHRKEGCTIRRCVFHQDVVFSQRKKGSPQEGVFPIHKEVFPHRNLHSPILRCTSITQRRVPTPACVWPPQDGLFPTKEFVFFLQEGVFSCIQCSIFPYGSVIPPHELEFTAQEVQFPPLRCVSTKRGPDSNTTSNISNTVIWFPPQAPAQEGEFPHRKHHFAYRKMHFPYRNYNCPNRKLCFLHLRYYFPNSVVCFPKKKLSLAHRKYYFSTGRSVSLRGRCVCSQKGKIPPKEGVFPPPECGFLWRAGVFSPQKVLILATGRFVSSTGTFPYWNVCYSHKKVCFQQRNLYFLRREVCFPANNVAFSPMEGCFPHMSVNLLHRKL